MQVPTLLLSARATCVGQALFPPKPQVPQLTGTSWPVLGCRLAAPGGWIWPPDELLAISKQERGLSHQFSSVSTAPPATYSEEAIFVLLLAFEVAL